MHQTPTLPMQRLWGKYRGKVLDNADPLMLGRIMPEVPALPGMLLNWAMPCTPYAGLEVGFYTMPQIGASVWIEFEGGDPDFPIWAGCFWEEGDMPVTLEPIEPGVKWFKTDFITMKLSDLPGIGGFKVTTIDPAVAIPQEMNFDSEGILISNPECSIRLTPASITLTCPPGEFAMQPEAITQTLAETSTITMTEASISVRTAEVIVVADVNITGAVQIEGDVNITGAVQVEGDVNITGGLEVEGPVAITGVTQITGDLNVTGAVEVEGDVAAVGALEVAGDVAVLGAQEIAGDLAVPLTETVVVPPLL